MNLYFDSINCLVQVNSLMLKHICVLTIKGVSLAVILHHDNALAAVCVLLFITSGLSPQVELSTVRLL